MSKGRITLEDLKDTVMRQVVALPTRPATIQAILDRPQWQVDAAVQSLVREGLVVHFRGFIRVPVRKTAVGKPNNPTFNPITYK